MRRLFPVPLRGVSAVAACLLAAVALPGSRAQTPSDPQAPVPAQAPPVFRAEANLVEVIVRVTDEEGRFVPGLSASDFELREDGRPQRVVAFDYVDRPRPAPPRTPAAPATPVAPDSSTVATNAGAAEARLFVLLLDDLHTAPFRTMPARNIAREFIEQYVGPSDLVAVFSTGGRGALTQEFTTDRTRVFAAIDRFMGARIRCCETEAEAVYHARAATDVIQQLSSHLGALRGRRITLVWVSEGIDYDLTGQQVPKGCLLRDSPPDQKTVADALERTVDTLRRANVTMYGIDPRRLAADEDIAIEAGLGCGSLPGGPRAILRRSIDNLRSLSEQTGGFAAVNTNGFEREFTRIIEESSQYYVLGFQPTRPGDDGEFRRIQVRVQGRPRLRVSARSGYVVSSRRPPVERPTDVVPELADALVSAVPTAGLPLRVQAIPRPGSSGLAQVHVLVEVAGSDLPFIEMDGQHQGRLEFALRTIDAQAKAGNNLKTTLTLTVPPARLERVRGHDVRWLSTLDLAPGPYSLRVAGHAPENRRTGAVFLNIDVPEFNDGLLWIGGLAVTTPTARDAVSAGTSPVPLGLTGPPTTIRRFAAGEVVTVSAGIATPADFNTGAIDMTIHRADVDGAPALVSRTIALPDRASALEPRTFAVETAALGGGEFIVRLRLHDDRDRSAETSMVFEVAPALLDAAP